MHGVFRAALEKVGGVVVDCGTLEQVADYLAGTVRGPLLFPSGQSLRQSELSGRLQTAGVRGN